MNEVAVAFLGDVVGGPGRRAVAQAVPVLRERHAARMVIVNGENARQGSGITPDNAKEIFRAGVSAITLGDHVFKDRAIIPVLEDPEEPICRPANLALGAPGKRSVRIDIAGLPPVHVVTVLGRLFMSIPSDSPFDAIDRELAAIRDPEAAVIVEVHAEATSEKQALAWHCLEKWTKPDRARVIAVLGTHTHVQTADARILDQTLAAMTDVGMTGPHRGVIGRSAEATVKAMTTQAPVPLEVATDDVRACGCVVRFDAATRRAIGIEAVDIAARE